MRQASAKPILAFDVGLKRTGVAIGNLHNHDARPLTTLQGQRGQLNWEQLDLLISEWQPETCVVGDPQTADPHLNKLLNRVIHYLQSHKIQVLRVDETLTSSAASAELAGRSLSIEQKTELRDQIAACFILQSYLSDPQTYTP